METTRIEFEPFIDEGVRQFIVDGIDYYNIAVTSLPNYFPINFVLEVSTATCLAGCLANSGEAGCR
jgi:hypothetical protein